MLFRAGRATVTLQAVSSVDGIVDSGRGMEIGFEVDDLEAVRQRLRAPGRDAPPTQMMGWGRAIETIDPDGYRVTIFIRRADAE